LDLVGDGLSGSLSSSCDEKYWVSPCGSSVGDSSSDSSGSSRVCGFSLTISGSLYMSFLISF
jgi:hypothetical protein